MKRLPITKAQRRGIEYRARWREQQRMIRAVRDALYARGYSGRYMHEFITDVLALLRQSKSQGGVK